MYLAAGFCGGQAGKNEGGEGKKREGRGEIERGGDEREGGIKQCDILCIQKAKAESQIAEMKQKCQDEQEEVSLGVCTDPPRACVTPAYVRVHICMFQSTDFVMFTVCVM